MIYRPHPRVEGPENRSKDKRIISKETESKLEKLHSLAQYIVIGSAGLYSVAAIGSFYADISEIVNIGIEFNLLTAATVSGAILGLLVWIIANK